jgi:hypothetical protein
MSPSDIPKAQMVPDRPRWPSVQRERGEGLLISLPSLHRDAIYVGIRAARRGPWHLGFGRQFTDRQPRWARFWMWHR